MKISRYILMICLLSLFIGFCISPQKEEVEPVPDFQVEESHHKIVKTRIELFSQEGAALLDNTLDYNPLMKNWVAQLKMHCGAASAVIVMNSLQTGFGYDQDNLFTVQTSRIITKELVFEQGFTLEELNAMIKLRSGLKCDYFHAGSAENEYPYKKFLIDLKANSNNPDSRIIILYSRASLNGTGTDLGHFSPVAAYNEQDDMVLLLEVADWKKAFWISTQDIYIAMSTIDKVCNLNRGWLVISR